MQHKENHYKTFQQRKQTKQHFTTYKTDTHSLKQVWIRCFKKTEMKKRSDQVCQWNNATRKLIVQRPALHLPNFKNGSHVHAQCCNCSPGQSDLVRDSTCRAEMKIVKMCSSGTFPQRPTPGKFRLKTVSRQKNCDVVDNQSQIPAKQIAAGANIFVTTQQLRFATWRGIRPMLMDGLGRTKVSRFIWAAVVSRGIAHQPNVHAVRLKACSVNSVGG